MHFFGLELPLESQSFDRFANKCSKSTSTLKDPWQRFVFFTQKGNKKSQQP
jgi:hypothetical protein